MTTKAERATTFNTTGKRKTAIARVIMTPGSGQILINKRPMKDYFGRTALQIITCMPFQVTGTVNKFDISANIKGGGLSGQADALKHGIARALLSMNPDYRKPLKKAGFLARDARIVERKKYGKHKARRSHQYSKR